MATVSNLTGTSVATMSAAEPAEFVTQPSDARSVFLGLLLGALPTALGVAWYERSRRGGSVGGIWVEVFFGNWFSPLEVWTFFIAVVFLIAKSRMIRRQAETFAALDANFLHANLDSYSNHESPGDFGAFFQNSLKTIIPNAPRTGLLVRRLRQWLNHAEETRGTESQLMSYGERLGESDGVTMSATYMLPRFCIWLLPILGFMGTVWGISQAVGGFAVAMSNQSSAEGLTSVLQEQLPLVTANLGTAFNTTLQALLLSVPLMLFLQHLERVENQHLSHVNERWSLQYLPRLCAYFVPAGTEMPSVASANAAVSPSSANVVAPSSDSSLASLGAELQTLSSQIMGLRAIMTELHETVYLDALQKATHLPRES